MPGKPAAARRLRSAPHTSPEPQGRSPVVAANLVVVFFGVSWGPVVWVLLGEMFPNRIRAARVGRRGGCSVVANFIVSVSFPVMSSIGLGFAYGVFTSQSPCCPSLRGQVHPRNEGHELGDMQEA